MPSRLIALICYSALIAISGCGGGGGGSGGGGQTPPAQTPRTPTGVTVAKGGDGAILVDWQSSFDASQYSIYWSASTGVTPQNGTRVVAAAPPLTIGGLTNDATYYVVITAENSAGASPPSQQAEGQAGQPPTDKVTGVSVIAGDGEATFSWDLQPHADNYSVFVGTSRFGGGGTEIFSDTSPFTATGLENGSQYYFQVAANNAAGQGSRSQVVDAIPYASVAGWARQVAVGESLDGLESQIAVKGLAINNNGVAAVSWLTMTGLAGARRSLEVAHNIGGSWDNQVGFGANSSSAPIAVTPDGDIHLIYDDDRLNVFWRRYRDGAWSDAEEIQRPSNIVAHTWSALAADDQGNVFATWVEEVPESPVNTHELWVRRFDAATDSWDDPVMVADAEALISWVEIDAAADNKAVVAWLQDSGAFADRVPGEDSRRRVVHASMYDGSTWQPGAAVGRNDLVDLDDGLEIELEANASGSAVVAWTQKFESAGGPISYEIGAARYDAQLSQWSAPEVVLSGATRFHSLTAGLGSGEEPAVAYRYNLSNSAWMTDYDATSMTWQPPEVLPTDDINNDDSFGIGADESDETVLLESNGGTGIFATRRAPGSPTWGDASLIGTRVGLRPQRFEISRNGHIIVLSCAIVAQNDDLEDQLFVITYTPP